MQAADFERSEVDVPNAIVDLFQADVFAGAAHADIDPLVVPSDTAIGADVSHFESIWIFQRGILSGMDRGEGA